MKDRLNTACGDFVETAGIGRTPKLRGSVYIAHRIKIYLTTWIRTIWVAERESVENRLCSRQRKLKHSPAAGSEGKSATGISPPDKCCTVEIAFCILHQPCPGSCSIRAPLKRIKDGLVP